MWDDNGELHGRPMSDISEFVIPDNIFEVPIVNGVLHISPSHDFIHHWEANGAWMLKYWNTDVEPPRMNNIPVNEEQANFLIKACGIEVCERVRMGTQEHEHYLAWASVNELAELDFIPEEQDDSEA